jgi:hypothetical protein
MPQRIVFEGDRGSNPPVGMQFFENFFFQLILLSRHITPT